MARIRETQASPTASLRKLGCKRTDSRSGVFRVLWHKLSSWCANIFVCDTKRRKLYGSSSCSAFFFFTHFSNDQAPDVVGRIVYLFDVMNRSRGRQVMWTKTRTSYILVYSPFKVNWVTESMSPRTDQTDYSLVRVAVYTFQKRFSSTKMLQRYIDQWSASADIFVLLLFEFLLTKYIIHLLVSFFLNFTIIKRYQTDINRCQWIPREKNTCRESREREEEEDHLFAELSIRQSKEHWTRIMMEIRQTNRQVKKVYNSMLLCNSFWFSVFLYVFHVVPPPPLVSHPEAVACNEIPFISCSFLHESCVTVE